MKAVSYTHTGAADDVIRWGEQPDPRPAEGEVRVRLRTSGVNPSDTKVRRGGFNRPLAGPLIIPHSDGAGVIDEVGAGVAASRIGERVWVWNAQWKRPFGTAAELVCLPAHQAVRMPDALGFEEAACLGIPARTALQAARLVQAGPGKAILVAGGAGAVGHYAIQMSKARGATVLATVSGDAKAAHARAAGADHVINYRSEDVGERVRAITAGAGVEGVIEMDLAANAHLYPSLLRSHALVAVYGTSKFEAPLPVLWLMQNSVRIQMIYVYELSDADRKAGLDELQELLQENRLAHAVGLRLALEETARAHQAIESGGVIGNVVLRVA